MLVSRSELIVVGHLMRGSITPVPPAAGFRNYKTRIVITEILKGSGNATEIPITIYHGLTPLLGGYIDQDGLKIDYRRIYGGREDSIQIIDTGNSDDSENSLVADAGDDNIWFLRRRSGNYGREPGTGGFGIVDPEDLQDISLKEYFQAYLSANPEAEIKRQVALRGDLEKRARRYLDHLEVKRILTIPDAESRIEALLPFYIKRQTWVDEHESIINEAKKGIIDCGKTSGPYLLRLFDDPNLISMKQDIIGILGDLHFEPAVDVLIKMLQENERFWSEQQLKNGWWNQSVESELTTDRRRKYGEVYCSVIALGQIGDPRAIEAIRLTRKRWVLINFENAQIVEACDAALAKLKQAGEGDKENKLRITKDR